MLKFFFFYNTYLIVYIKKRSVIRSGMCHRFLNLMWKWLEHNSNIRQLAFLFPWDRQNNQSSAYTLRQWLPKRNQQ
jgi:hypothetical protein